MIVNIYTCWVSLMLPSHQDPLITGLVKKGYTIGPACEDLTLSASNEKRPVFLLAFTAHKAGKDILAKEIYDDILSILLEIKAFYYSVIVAHAYDATWIGCNFSFPDKKSPPPLPNPTPPNKSSLN